MKKVLLFTIAGFLGAHVSAQIIQETSIESQSASIDIVNQTTPNYSKSPILSPEAAGDTIWIEDFANGIPTGWILSGANSSSCPWRYSHTGSNGFFNGSYPVAADPMNSVTASNGFLLCDPDSSNQALYGQPSGTTYQYLESFITSAPVDLSANPSVRLEFEQSFRYNNSPTLDVSVSTDGVTWTTFDAKGTVGANQASADPTTFSIDVSSIVGGSSTAYIKIGWSARVYFWMIDDIRFVIPPANDLAITQEYYNGYADSTNTLYYKRIPSRQASSDTITFGGVIENVGSVAQTNTQVQVEVDYNGNNIFGATSTGITSMVGASDSLDVSATFSANSGTGMYSVTFTAISDSVDGTPFNNVIADSFEVTANEYARDNSILTSGNWYNATSDWEMLSLFRMGSADTALAISVRFPVFSSGRGLAEGDAVSYYLYADADLENPIAKNEFHIVTAAEVDTWITLPLPIVTLTPGFYYAGFKIYNDNSAVGSNSEINAKTPPFSVLVRVDAATAADPWSYTTSLTPFIHLFTSDPDACNGVTIAIADTVYDNQEIGAINIGVTGGTPNYTYSWTGPQGYVSTVQNPNDIPHQGVYNVVVTDVFGCTGSLDVPVAGIVTVDELGFDNTLSLFPNPNSGTFRLTADNVASGEYTVVVRNVVGQNIYVQTISANGSISQDIQLDNLNKGVYFLELSNEAGNKEVIKFIVE